MDTSNSISFDPESLPEIEEFEDLQLNLDDDSSKLVMPRSEETNVNIIVDDQQSLNQEINNAVQSLVDNKLNDDDFIKNGELIVDLAVNSNDNNNLDPSNFITRNRPRYKVIFEDDDLEALAHPKYTENFQRASFFENQKAEILVSSIVLISLIIIVIYTVNYYRKRRSIIRYKSGTSSENNSTNINSSNGSHTTSNLNSTSNMESDNLSGNQKLLRELQERQEQHEMEREQQKSSIAIVMDHSGRESPNFSGVLGIADDYRIGQKSMQGSPKSVDRVSYHI